MKNNFNIITLLSDGHNFAFHGFWRTTDISEKEICIRSEKSIYGLYKVGDVVEISLFPSEFPPIHIRCSFEYIEQKEFELGIIDFPSLKDRQLYDKLMADSPSSEKEFTSKRVSDSEKLHSYAH